MTHGLGYPLPAAWEDPEVSTAVLYESLSTTRIVLLVYNIDITASETMGLKKVPIRLLPLAVVKSHCRVLVPWNKAPSTRTLSGTRTSLEHPEMDEQLIEWQKSI